MEQAPRPPFTHRLKRWHLVAFDSLLGLLVFLFTGHLARNLAHYGHRGVPVGFGIALALACAVAVTVRRLWPLTALGVVVTASIALALCDFSRNPYPQLALTLYVVALVKPPRVALAGLASAVAAWCVAGGVSYLLPPPLHQRAEIPVWSMGTVLLWVIPISCWTVGWALSRGRAYQEGLRDLAEQRYRAERSRAERTVTEERLRVAREVHDVVGHTLGVIAVQAGVGRYVGTGEPEEAIKSLAAIETASRGALMEMRALLGALRDADSIEAIPAGLGNVDAVIAQARRAGVAVDLVVSGAPHTLTAEADLAAFRIVQEALTNVVRHAQTDRARVAIVYHDDAVAIEVLDHGVGTKKSATTAGHGLIGIRERVALHGGAFSACPVAPHGFRVSARLPYAHVPDTDPLLEAVS